MKTLEFIRDKLVRENTLGYLMIAPFFFFFFFFVLAPIFANFYLSFTNYDLRSLSYVGFSNYINIWSDKLFMISLKNTLIYVIFVVFFSMGLGLVSSIVLNQKIIGVKFLRAGFFIPHVVSMVAVSMIWIWIYEPSTGALNNFLSMFGIKEIRWLYDPKYAMPAIIIMSIWKTLGYNMVIYLAGLQGVPRHLYEAADIDGASGWRKFTHITFPLLKPVTFFLFVTGTINGFRVFEQVNVLTEGGPVNSTTTIVHQIYMRAFTDFQMGYAASMSIVLLIIVAVITLTNFKFGNQGEDMST